MSGDVSVNMYMCVSPMKHDRLRGFMEQANQYPGRVSLEMLLVGLAQHSLFGTPPMAYVPPD